MTVPVPYSYRQYAGNGANKDFSVPFPYLEKAHVHVYLGFNLLDGTFTSELAETTGFAWTSGTVVRTVTAPATGATLTVIRKTPNGQQLVEWQDGSNLIAADLNTSDLQNLYAVQEQQDRNDAGIVQSNEAKAASTAATAAAATATTTATTATTASTTATATANSALSQSASATSTANTSLSTANAANAKADQALSASSNSTVYTLIATVAGIPASPADNTYIEVGNSTGIESFTPLAGKPSGFIGDAGLAVRLRYTTAGATWNWLNFYAINSEARYLKLDGGTMTGNITLVGAPTSNLHPATKLYADTALSAKLDISTASSTYQTKASMSSYPTTAMAFFLGSF